MRSAGMLTESFEAFHKVSLAGRSSTIYVKQGMNAEFLADMAEVALVVISLTSIQAATNMIMDEKKGRKIRENTQTTECVAERGSSYESLPELLYEIRLATEVVSVREKSFCTSDGTSIECSLKFEPSTTFQ
ncbi:hypothetical protein MPTK1_3g03460 [Marchantia polymorpha subsp. ruderalis]|uniref:Uncharacterized protein n=2 Tax=Marchantia polymorpha TaxID=3197 RepID=A0AAF6AX13_MARPO|nr:hypothetical protein MARPO_0022s0186 [Marchantia polymorpha]BBN04297.1 hypothetical protein Mp_3g03460 [Marchantia polymorpha subsp. ruderalis]|eukprot:PTQ44108.1 hypothetical protein MARPO_0022s0186 [Marchantia polymorpha]